MDEERREINLLREKKHPLEKTGCLMPPWILSPSEIDKLDNHAITELALRTIDGLRELGEDVSSLEAVLATWIEGGYTSETVAIALLPTLKRVHEAMPQQYDSVTGLCYFPVSGGRRLKLFKTVEKAIYGKAGYEPELGICVLDIEGLHEKNSQYGGKEEVNVGLQALAKHLVDIIGGFPDEISKKGSIFLFRQRATGDEILAVFVGNNQAFRLFQEKIRERPWPTVPLVNSQTGQEEDVVFSARVEPLSIDDPEIKPMVTEGKDAGGILDEMIRTAEYRSDQKGSKRNEN